jgi:DNA-binding XRE family transcriptional regulator
MNTTYALRTWQPAETRHGGLLQGTMVVTLVALFGGTGGDAGPHQLIKHYGNGTGSAMRTSPEAFPAAPVQGMAIELQTIRAALRLSVAEMAQLFDVTRPTIYSWQNGSPIRDHNAKRVRSITRALEPHLALLESQVGRVAHRAIEGRTTLLQKLAQGGDAAETMERLAGILQREVTQRERLAQRLRNRGVARGSADLDAMD